MDVVRRTHCHGSARDVGSAVRLRSSVTRANIGSVIDRLNTRQRVLLLMGSIGPIGHLPASGTLAVALCGIPLYYAMAGLSNWLYLAVTLAFTLASVALHQAGDRLLGEKDSRKLVWDELVGYMIAVAFISRFTWQVALIGFFLERIIDIAKVPPANWIERRVPGGWGVVGDDVIAGLYTCGLLHLMLHFVVPQWA